MSKPRKVPSTVEEWFKRLEPKAGAFVRDMILGEPQDVIIAEYLDPEVEPAMKTAVAETEAEMKNTTKAGAEPHVEWAGSGLSHGSRVRLWRGGRPSATLILGRWA